MATEVSSTDIATAALEPKRVRTDAGEVEQRNIVELIKAAEHITSNTSASKAHRGLRFTKLIPGGAD